MSKIKNDISVKVVNRLAQYLRSEFGTYSNAANYLGISSAQVNRYLKGDSFPPYNILERLFNNGLEPNWLFRGDRIVPEIEVEKVTDFSIGFNAAKLFDLNEKSLSACELWKTKGKFDYDYLLAIPTKDLSYSEILDNSFTYCVAWDIDVPIVQNLYCLELGDENNLEYYPFHQKKFETDIDKWVSFSVSEDDFKDKISHIVLMFCNKANFSSIDR